MVPTLKYFNQKFHIDDIEFPNSIVKQTKTEYFLDDNIKEVYYQEYSNKNYIIYNDDTKKELENYEIFFDEIIRLATYFEFEYNEFLFLEQQNIINRPKPELNLRNLFETNISKLEQQEYIQILKDNYPEIEFNNILFLSTLNNLKKSLLKQSDWTQLPDVQNSFSDKEKEEWVTYRATLRTLDDTKKPLSVRLPKKPGA